MSVNILRAVALPSIIRARNEEMATPLAARSASDGISASANRSLNENVLPAPTLLSRVISPPID